MNKTRAISTILTVLAALGLTLLVADAAISSILMGGKVTVTEMTGSVEYTSNPFTVWASSINIQGGATWNTRIHDLTMDYAGDVNVTWTLYDAGPDGNIGTMDDSIIPGASFMQTRTVAANVPQNVASSSDGFNPYNWGQWTSSPVVVYVQAEVKEA